MSDDEIRRLLTDVHAATIRAEADMNWIKCALRKGSARMDEHDRRIGSIESMVEQGKGGARALTAAYHAVSAAAGALAALWASAQGFLTRPPP